MICYKHLGLGIIGLKPIKTALSSSFVRSIYKFNISNVILVLPKVLKNYPWINI